MPKDKYDKPSYADMLILGGLRIGVGAKKQFKKDIGKLKKALKRKKRKKKDYVTTRTSGITKMAGDVAKEKSFKRMRGKK